MRFKLKMLLTKNELPLEYRRIIISFFKHAIQETGKNEFFEKYFSKNNVSKKPYCFYLSFPVDKVQGDKFLLKSNEATLYFSSADITTYLIFKNAIINQINKPFLYTGHNFMIITDILDEKEKIIANNSVVVQTRGYICISETNGNNKDRKYYTYKDEKFNSIFEEKTSLKFTTIDCTEKNTNNFNSTIMCTSGMFLLQGSPDKIKECYLNGLGDRSSQGYGYIDII